MLEIYEKEKIHKLVLYKEIYKITTKVIYYYIIGKGTIKDKPLNCKVIDDINTGKDKNRILISPWFNIKLTQDFKTYNFIIEIGNKRIEKYEMQAQDFPLHPIRQNTIDNVLRFKCQSLNRPSYLYGAFPQTYEDPRTGYVGDNDPLDGIILFKDKLYELDVGDIVKVKLLGAFPLIDEKKTDWKILAVPVGDSYYKDINNLQQLLLSEGEKIKEIINYSLESKYIEKNIGNNIYLKKIFMKKNTNNIHYLEKYPICDELLTHDIVTDANNKWKLLNKKIMINTQNKWKTLNNKQKINNVLI